MARWGYVGHFKSSNELPLALSNAGNFASAGTPTENLSFYFSNGSQWITGGISSTGIPWIDPQVAPYNAVPGSTDSTASFQRIIDDWKDNGGCNVLVNDTYTISKLQVPDPINFIGVSNSDGKFLQLAGTIGPLFECVAWTAQSVGHKEHVFEKFSIDCTSVGVIKSTGKTTAASATVTNIVAADITEVSVGYLIEGIGIPEWTLVATINGSRDQVTMKDINGAAVVATGPNHVDNGAWFTRDKLVFRQAITITATAVSGSKILTCSNSAGVFRGMRCRGTNLEVDGDDLSSWSRVESVDSTTQITLDRAATATGSFQCLFYVYNDAMLWVEPTLISNYDPTKTYNSAKNYRRPVLKNVFISKAGGDCLVLRPGCIGYHIDEFCRFDSGNGFGVSITACADGYWQRFGTGSHWKGCIVVSSSATPRGSGETFFTYLSDKYYDQRFQGIREGQLYDMEINGRLYIKGRADEPAPMISIHNINFKFEANNRVPYGQTDAYIVCDNVIVNAVQGGFKGSRDVITPTAADLAANGPWGPLKPDSIVKTVNNGALHISSMNWTDDITLKECPYLLYRTNENRLFGTYSQSDHQVEVSTQRYSFTPVFDFATTGDLSVVYTEQYGYVTVSGGIAYVHAAITFTPTYTTSSGNALIKGLPVAALSTISGREMPINARSDSVNTDWTAGMTQISAAINNNNNILLYKTGDNKNAGTLAAASFPTTLGARLEVWGVFPLVPV